MVNFFAGFWFGALTVVVVCLFVSEKPMRDRCNKLGSGYNVVTYNDSVFVCSNGRQKVTMYK